MFLRIAEFHEGKREWLPVACLGKEMENILLRRGSVKIVSRMFYFHLFMEHPQTPTELENDPDVLRSVFALTRRVCLL